MPQYEILYLNTRIASCEEIVPKRTANLKGFLGNMVLRICAVPISRFQV